MKRGGRATPSGIPAPTAEWDSPYAAFSAAFNHEQAQAQRVGRRAEDAKDEEDHATYSFLQWFVREQSKEENELREIVGRMRLLEGDPQGSFLLDRELGDHDN